MDTWLTRTAGIDVPLVQAPMARVSEGAMAAAVSGAGALGMIGVGPTMSPADVAEQARVAAAPGRPFGIGLMAWALERSEAHRDDRRVGVQHRVEGARVALLSLIHI